MKKKKVLVTGGAGYVGSELVGLLIEENYEVIIYDLFLFSEASEYQDLKFCKVKKGDIRDIKSLKEEMIEADYMIHLACVSNDPSFDLNPELGKSINFDCFEEIVKAAKESKIKRFIFASSSSVYGIKQEDNVSEELDLEPLTDYSKYKALCESILNNYGDDNFEVVSLRPATVCGRSKRQRLDVVVNILTNHAYNNKKIKIFGGDQKRPNIHIKDMCRAYLEVLRAEKSYIHKKIFNVGHENIKVKDIAKLVSKNTGVTNIEVLETDDNRSYHISSQKFYNTFNFKPQYSVDDAIIDLVLAFKSGDIESPLENPKYFNIKYLLNNNIK